MSFPLPDHILQSPHVAFKQLMQEVKNNQNGVVASQMKAQGLVYDLNYGVTMPILKDLASSYKKDNALAIQLWNCNIREGFLLAFLMFEPANIAVDQIVKVTENVDNIELIEQGAVNLFGHLHNIKEVVRVLLEKNEFQKTLALYTFGWGIKRGPIDEVYQQGVFVSMQELVSSKEKVIIKGLIFAMQAILLSNNTLKGQVMELAEKMAQSDVDFVKQSGEEFIWLHKE